MCTGIMLVGILASGFSQIAPPAFEVASVKPAPLPPSGRARPTGAAGPLSNGPGQISYPNISLHTLLTSAYGVKDYQISGPSWLDSERFEIIAKLPPGTSKEQIPVMLQRLLADRFKLKLHREEKELPIYALVIGKNGPKLKESHGDGDTGFRVSPGRIRMSVRVSRSPFLLTSWRGRLIDRYEI